MRTLPAFGSGIGHSSLNTVEVRARCNARTSNITREDHGAFPAARTVTSQHDHSACIVLGQHGTNSALMIEAILLTVNFRHALSGEVELRDRPPPAAAA